MDRTEVTDVGSISNFEDRETVGIEISSPMCKVRSYCMWLLVSIHISICLLRAGTSITNIGVTTDVMLNLKAD